MSHEKIGGKNIFKDLCEDTLTVKQALNGLIFDTDVEVYLKREELIGLEEVIKGRLKTLKVPRLVVDKKSDEDYTFSETRGGKVNMFADSSGDTLMLGRISGAPNSFIILDKELLKEMLPVITKLIEGE